MVNTGDMEAEASNAEETEDGGGVAGNVRMLGNSAVREPLTELCCVLDGAADERAEVPDGARLSWKYA